MYRYPRSPTPMSIIPGRPRLLPFPLPTRACSWSCLMFFLGLRFQNQSIVVEMATTHNLWGHREGLILKVRNKPECKLDEGKYILELSAEEKICKMQGKPLSSCCVFQASLHTGSNFNSPVYLHMDKREPKTLSLS